MSIPKSRAILTTYYSESMYYPLWERYYAPFFDHVEKYIYPFEMKKDYIGRVMVMNAKLKQLLHKYDVVVIADEDEIIVPDPEKYKDLGDYLDRFDGEGARVIGYNIMEMPGALPLDIELKITDQRFYWQRDPLYDKPMIARVEFNFRPGKHTCDRDLPQDPDLYLFHLRDADLHYLIVSSGLKRDQAFVDRINHRQLEATPIPEKWRVI